MKRAIIVVSTDEEQPVGFSTMLEDQDCEVVLARSTQSLGALSRTHRSSVIIIDLDTVPADNRLLRRLKQENPSVHILLISARVFHPELREAMMSCVDLCLSKPANPDELAFWMKSVFQDQPQPGPDPGPSAESNPAIQRLDTSPNAQADEEMSQ